MEDQGRALPVVNPDGANPWLAGAASRGTDYDRRFEQIAASGHNVHGEADFVGSLEVDSVLDAGCGTGRVAIELARRGLDVVGVDIDPEMLDEARKKAPLIPWFRADLAEVDLGRRFEAVVVAGNVMIFLTRGTEGAVLANLGRHLHEGGLLVSGFSLTPDRLELDEYDRLAAAANLTLVERWATWDRRTFEPDGDYAVSMHRLAAPTSLA